MSEWSPWKKWWLDVLKFAVTFSLGAFFSVLVLNAISEQRAMEAFQLRKNWERDLQVLDEFREASLLYVQATKGAFAELSRGPEGELVQQWKGPMHSRFLLALEGVNNRFSMRDSSIAGLLDKIEVKRRALYQEYLALKKRKEKPGYYAWSETLNDLIKLRQILAQAYEGLISRPPDRKLYTGRVGNI
jgi:hypothetical protein